MSKQTPPIPPSIHPWVKGFRPPTTCKKCGVRDSLAFTGERTEGTAYHVYRCIVCGADFAAPTLYKLCTAYDAVLEKDVYYTPCIHGGCRRFEGTQANPNRCAHLKPWQQRDMDGPDWRRIENSMKRFTVAEKQPAGDPGAAGVPSDLYKRMRAERLRKLREGG